MAGGGISKKCRLCKGMLHANQELYCQHCAYKNGLCTMCGKQVQDTSMYASGQLWDGSEDLVRDTIAEVQKEQEEAQRFGGRSQNAMMAEKNAMNAEKPLASLGKMSHIINAAQATDIGGAMYAPELDDSPPAAEISVTFGGEGPL